MRNQRENKKSLPPNSSQSMSVNRKEYKKWSGVFVCICVFILYYIIKVLQTRRRTPFETRSVKSMFCNPIFAKLFLIKNVTNICQTTEQLIELMNRSNYHRYKVVWNCNKILLTTLRAIIMIRDVLIRLFHAFLHYFISTLSWQRLGSLSFFMN